MFNIILIGFSHCGKTSSGKLLAEKLGYPFIDTDQLMLVGTEFKTSRELHKALGNAAFRDLEAEKIAALNEYENTVIATGGGAVLMPANQEILSQLGKLVYLVNTAEILWARIKRHGIPSYLSSADDPYAAFLELYKERDAVYRRVADLLVDTQNKSPERVAAQLARKFS